MEFLGRDTDGVIVETERTRLRPHRYSDLQDVAAFWAEPAIVEFILPAPLRRSEAWTRLLRYVGHWAMLPYGYWVVEDKRSGEFLGEVGFGDWKREIVPSIEGVPEIGWAIKPSAQGQGLAVEVTRAALKWADENVESMQTVALINPAHDVSRAIARQVGFGEPVAVPFRGASILMFRRNRPSPAEGGRTVGQGRDRPFSI